MLTTIPAPTQQMEARYQGRRSAPRCTGNGMNSALRLSERMSEQSFLDPRAVADLLQAVSNAFRDSPAEAHECVSQVIATLRVDPANSRHYGCGAAGVAGAPRGGFAPWQVRKLTSYIETHLDSVISNVALAGLVRVSLSHFCRSFLATFNETSHTYVMRRRIERAQRLMLQTTASLAQIAIDCGLADQAHLSKSFRRFVGESPGAWRRARAIAPPESHCAVVEKESTPQRAIGWYMNLDRESV